MTEAQDRGSSARLAAQAGQVASLCLQRLHSSPLSMHPLLLAILKRVKSLSCSIPFSGSHDHNAGSSASASNIFASKRFLACRDVACCACCIPQSLGPSPKPSQAEHLLQLIGHLPSSKPKLCRQQPLRSKRQRDSGSQPA